jgi:hypothetical protein
MFLLCNNKRSYDSIEKFTEFFFRCSAHPVALEGRYGHTPPRTKMTSSLRLQPPLEEDLWRRTSHGFTEPVAKILLSSESSSKDPRTRLFWGRDKRVRFAGARGFLGVPWRIPF